MRVPNVKLTILLVACAGCGGIIDHTTPLETRDASPPGSSGKDASALVDVGVPDVSAPPVDAGSPPDPKTVLVSNAQIMDFAVDDSWVYWTDFSRKVIKVSVQGGAPVVLATQQTNPVFIAVDGTSIYWSNQGLQTPHTATIMKMPIGGGTPLQLAECPSFCGPIAVDSSHVYWGSDTDLMRANLDGSNAETIVTSASAHRILVRSGVLLWSAGPDFQLNQVVRANLDGTNQAVIASEYGIHDIATDGTFAYFISSTGGGGQLDRVSLSGGSVTTFASGAGGGYAGPVAVDGTNIYFSWFGGDGFMKMPIGGGTPTHVTIKVNYYYEATNAIIEHGASLYWLGFVGGSQATINVTPK